jgi:hypothetical protein
MKFVKSVFLFALFFLSISCHEDKPKPSRSFYMGFTPFPFDLSLEAVESTYSNITTNGDIINHHFDNGVPWTEALNDNAFSDNVMNDWNFRKQHTPSTHRVYLSVSALNPDRNGLALYHGASDNLPLESPWNTYSFSSNEVKTAYLNYCKRIIDFFEPDYFNMSIEANLLHFLEPTKWTDYVQFHQYIYESLKSAYPSLPIFCSITGAHILEGYFDGSDVSLERLAALQILAYSDMFAISFYPYISKYLGNPYPKESFDELFKISSKPLAIAETGYPAQSFTMDTNNSQVTVESDEAKQDLFINDLLKSCNEHNATFVISFVVRDYDQLWEDLGSKNDITIAWRDSGLIDEQGRERESFATWKDYFARPLR